MSCEETKHLLYDAALGEETDRAALGRHLASCAACRAEFADLELTRKLLLQGLPEEEPARRIAFAPAAPERRGWELGGGGWWAFAGAVAMALLLTVLPVRKPVVPPAAPQATGVGSEVPAFTRAEVEKIAAAAVEESERRHRSETAAMVNAAVTRLSDQMRYFERTQTLVYKQAEQNRSELETMAGLIGRDQAAREGGVR